MIDRRLEEIFTLRAERDVEFDLEKRMELEGRLRELIDSLLATEGTSMTMAEFNHFTRDAYKVWRRRAN